MGMGGGARAIPQELDATAEGRPQRETRTPKNGAHLGMAWPRSPEPQSSRRHRPQNH